MARSQLPFAYFAVQTGFLEHPKLRRLASKLSCTVPEAVYAVLGLWSYCTKYYPDGNISNMSSIEMEEATRTTDGSATQAALLASGWLDEVRSPHRAVKLHGWEESQPGIISCLRERTRRASRKRRT